MSDTERTDPTREQLEAFARDECPANSCCECWSEDFCKPVDDPERYALALAAYALSLLDRAEKAEAAVPKCPDVDRCMGLNARVADAEAALEAERKVSATDALRSVVAERARQDARWGVQDHVLTDWVPILGEEFGEFCQAVLEGDTFDNGRRDEFTVDAIRTEAVQVSAVALAIAECIDREAARTATKEAEE